MRAVGLALLSLLLRPEYLLAFPQVIANKDLPLEQPSDADQVQEAPAPPLTARVAGGGSTCGRALPGDADAEQEGGGSGARAGHKRRGGGGSGGGSEGGGWRAQPPPPPQGGGYYAPAHALSPYQMMPYGGAPHNAFQRQHFYGDSMAGYGAGARAPYPY